MFSVENRPPALSTQAGVRQLLFCAVLLATIFPNSAAGEPPEPVPGAKDGSRTARILEARDAGLIEVVARVSGEERIGLTIRNLASQRLQVILPPGMVAVPVAGPPRPLGLGDAGNAPGSFGAFGVERAVAVPVGLAVELSVPAVRLDFGTPGTPEGERLRLIDVADATRNPLARKALRTVAALGTGLGVAQAVAWHAFAGVTFEELARQSTHPLNPDELALARGLFARLGTTEDDRPAPGEAVARERITVQVRGEGALAEEARRLADALEGRRLLGLVAKTADSAPANPNAPALHLEVVLIPGRRSAPTTARVTVRSAPAGGPWRRLAPAADRAAIPFPDFAGPSPAEALDRALAAAFVSARPIRHAPGLTTLRIDNRLPFTVAGVDLSVGDAPVPVPRLGIGPGRHGTAPIQAAKGTVERIELNGL